MARLMLFAKLSKFLELTIYLDANFILPASRARWVGFLEERDREMCLELFDEYNGMKKTIY